MIFCILFYLALLLSRFTEVRSTTAPGYHRYRGAVVFPGGSPCFIPLGRGGPSFSVSFSSPPSAVIQPEPVPLGSGPARTESTPARTGVFSYGAGSRPAYRADANRGFHTPPPSAVTTSRRGQAFAAPIEVGCPMREGRARHVVHGSYARDAWQATECLTISRGKRPDRNTPRPSGTRARPRLCECAHQGDGGCPFPGPDAAVTWTGPLPREL